MTIRAEKYTSEKLSTRKVRILREARNIIGEKGLDGFNMRELAGRSGVALATLYNIYGSKDALIGKAVNDFFEPIVESTLAKAKRKSSLHRLLLLIDQMCKDIIVSRAYAKVVVSLYYKPEPGDKVHRMLYDIAFNEFSLLIDSLRNPENFHVWVSTGLLADEISEQIMVRIYQWCREDIRDDEFSDVVKCSVLQIILGATKGTLYESISRHLKQLTKKQAARIKRGQSRDG